MISEHAKHAVNAIFTKAAKANLTVNPEDSIEISQGYCGADHFILPVSPADHFSRQS